MPELPEVELVARALHRHCVGRRVVRARLLRERLAPSTTPTEFARALKNRTVTGVSRRGKHILVAFDRDVTLIVHLRMSGRFLLLPKRAALPAYTHALFHLDDERRLAFSDQRHFGLMKIVAADGLHEAAELAYLAPEPFSEDFSDAYLRDTLAKTNRRLKEVLLDQTKVTGLGNIYAVEAMFLAGVNPLAQASKISRTRVARLRAAILRVLEESIAHGSTLNVDPENIDGSYYGGGYGGKWQVYDREGDPCARCRTPIRRVAQAGRSTYYCARCQRY